MMNLDMLKILMTYAAIPLPFRGNSFNLIKRYAKPTAIPITVVANRNGIDNESSASKDKTERLSIEIDNAKTEINIK